MILWDVQEAMGQYGKFIHSLTGFTYWSCLEQLKCNTVASSDRLGTVNTVVWG